MTDREKEKPDLSGDWVSEEILDLRPPSPGYDWLDEFATEAPPEPVLEAQPPQPMLAAAPPEPVVAVEPPRRPVEPLRHIDLAARDARLLPVRAARNAPWSRRRSLVTLAAGIALVALVESPAVDRPWLLVPWVDVAPAPPAPLHASFSASPLRSSVVHSPAVPQPSSLPPRTTAPSAIADASRSAERTGQQLALQAKRELRPEAPPAPKPQPPARSNVSAPPVVAERTSAAYLMPPALSAKPVTSLDGLLGRPVASPPLPAPPIAPAPPPAAATGVSTVEAAARSAKIAAVQSVVDSYRRAFNTLDANAVGTFWPGVDVRGLRRAFDQLELQRFEFERCKIDLAGPRAFASCDGSARSVRRVGDRNPRAQPREWTFTLGQSNDAWVILSVSSRAAQ